MIKNSNKSDISEFLTFLTEMFFRPD